VILPTRLTISWLRPFYDDEICGFPDSGDFRLQSE
jgi:hypothetical protein